MYKIVDYIFQFLIPQEPDKKATKVHKIIIVVIFLAFSIAFIIITTDFIRSNIRR